MIGNGNGVFYKQFITPYEAYTQYSIHIQVILFQILYTAYGLFYNQPIHTWTRTKVHWDSSFMRCYSNNKQVEYTFCDFVLKFLSDLRYNSTVWCLSFLGFWQVWLVFVIYFAITCNFITFYAYFYINFTQYCIFVLINNSVSNSV